MRTLWVQGISYSWALPGTACLSFSSSHLPTYLFPFPLYPLPLPLLFAFYFPIFCSFSLQLYLPFFWSFMILVCLSPTSTAQKLRLKILSDASCKLPSNPQYGCWDLTVYLHKISDIFSLKKRTLVLWSLGFLIPSEKSFPWLILSFVYFLGDFCILFSLDRQRNRHFSCFILRRNGV